MIKSDVFNIKNYKERKVSELKSKLGRNDLCHCGSSKKYKSCCAKKDAEEEFIRNKLNQIETISDKYFTVKEYIELAGYPLRKFDFFLIELLNIAGSILDKYNKANKEKSKEIITVLYNYSKDFYSKCINCEYNCLKTPEKNISFKYLIDKGLDISSLPEELQKQTSINFFYIEFIGIFSFKLEEELGKEIDKEIAEDMAATVYWYVMDSVVDNCIGDCENECLAKHEHNAYCDFCSFASENLPCPKKGNISYEIIKESEKDMIH